MTNKKNKPTKENLKELCEAHSELVQIRQKHTQEKLGSTVLIQMFDEKIQELESEITETMKAWLDPDRSNQSSKKKGDPDIR